MEYPATSVLWEAIPLFGLKFTKVIWISHIHVTNICISIFPLSVTSCLASKVMNTNYPVITHKFLKII